MGWSLKKIFSKKGMASILPAVASGGMLPGYAELMATDKGKNLFQDLNKGLANLGTGGYIAQKEATEEAKKARDQAADQYSEQTAAVEAETQRLADLDEERKKKLAAQGTKNPQTLLGGYGGVSGGASLYKSLLGA